MDVVLEIKRLLNNKLSLKQKRRVNRVLRGNRVRLLFNLDKGFDLANKVLIGTHHKTGTIWLDTIFKNIAAFHSLKFLKGELKKGLPGYQILFDNHSGFDFSLLSEPYKGAHMIRDPRDVIVSGAFYHQKSREEWLHIPKDEFNGMTYQEKINSYSSFDDKMLFEMENRAGCTINDMSNWNYENPNIFELKYEELIRDFNLKIFHQLFTFLGFPGKAIPSSLAIAYSNSLFSGKVDGIKHVRSGKTKQYKKYFKPSHKERFIELFNDVLIKLRYEEDNDWAVE